MQQCEKCVNRDCRLRGLLSGCPNFRDDTVNCENCIYNDKCVEQNFFDWCNKFKLNKRKENYEG